MELTSSFTTVTLYASIFQVQAANTTLNIYITLAEFLPAIVMVLVLGAYSDKMGRRPLFILPLIGSIGQVQSFAHTKARKPGTFPLEDPRTVGLPHALIFSTVETCVTGATSVVFPCCLCPAPSPIVGPGRVRTDLARILNPSRFRVCCERFLFIDLIPALF